MLIDHILATGTVRRVPSKLESGIVSGCLVFLLLVLTTSALAATDIFTSSATWTAPAGVTSVDVEVWGGGGAGGGQNQTSDGGGGGGGGAYSKRTGIPVTPGNTYTVVVGTGGVAVTSGTGGAGGDSSFINTTTVLAKGGTGGAPSTGTPPAGGAGGAASAGVGTTKFSGGAGGKGRDNNTGQGGPGGSSAGTATNGTNGTDPWSAIAAAAAPAGAGIGGNGGGAGTDGLAPASGNGGGGGGSGDGSGRKGGNGATGKVVITYGPAVSSINRVNATPTNAGSVQWSVIFSQSVTGVSASNFTLANSGLGGAPAITSVTGSGTTWTVTASTGTGAGTLGLNMTSSAGITVAPNGLPVTGQVYDIDRIVPTVSSMNRAGTNPSSAASVTWAVTFSESVAGVTAADFSLAMGGGMAGASITQVTGSGSAWTVTAATGNITGTLGLSLVDQDRISDAAGNFLGGTGLNNGNFTGQVYNLVPPVCLSGMLFCDDFERAVNAGGSNVAGAVGTASAPYNVFGSWTVSPLGSACAGISGNSGCAGIDSDIPPFNNASNPRANSTKSLFTRWSEVWVTSPVINLAGRPAAQISFWLRRGSDCFSEWPGNINIGCDGTVPPYTPDYGEEFQIQYRNSANTWITLAQYPMTDTPGEILVPVIDLPDDALHSAFQFRFYQPGGSGSSPISGYGAAPGVRGYDYWHVDNVLLKALPATVYVGAFCDTFEGDLSRWTMTGTGNARIGSTYFQNGSHNLDLRWSTVSATTKATDISTATGNITFWVKRGVGTNNQSPNTTGSNFPETGKNLRVDYLNNAGSWLVLETFPGGGTAGQVFTRSYPLPADAKHSKFKLRFTLMTGTGFDLDYWHVDDVCVGTILPNADLSIAMTSSGTFSPGQVVNYTMTVTNNGPDKEPGAITITDTLPDGLTFLTGSPGWDCTAAGQVITCTRAGELAVGASAALTISALINPATSGTVKNTAVVGGQSLDGLAGNNAASKTDTIFVPSFEFTTAPCVSGIAFGPPPAPCDKIAWSSQVAGVAMGNIYITAVNASNVPTQLSGTGPTTVNMQFGLSCHDPKAHAGLQASFTTATASVLPFCTANGAMPTAWTAAVGLSFAAGASTVGPYSFSYPDVGMVELYMRNSAATSQVGASEVFVVKPYSLVLTDIKQTASPYIANPEAADAAGGRFVRASENFSATVTAVNASCEAALSTYKFLADIPETCKAKNYGKETSPEGVQLINTLVTGLGLTSNPDLVNSSAFGSFNGGSATGTTFGWDEVGIIQLTPIVGGDKDYLGAGNVTGTTTGNVGRFTPHHFDTLVTQGCNTGSFTYSAQPFTVQAVAMNGASTPATTQNYDGTTGASPSFAKEVTLSDASVAPVGTLANTTIAAGAFIKGKATTTTPTYTFTNVRTIPTNIPLHARDTDENTSGGVEGTANIRSGRLWLTNAYGSEFLDLPVPIQAQYWLSTGWQLNKDDNCTQLVRPTSTNGLTNSLAANSTAKMGGSTAALVALSGGNARFVLGAPDPSLQGVVDISSAVLLSNGTTATWLPPNTAKVRACFGRCGPRSAVIYMRERF